MQRITRAVGRASKGARVQGAYVQGSTRGVRACAGEHACRASCVQGSARVGEHACSEGLVQGARVQGGVCREAFLKGCASEGEYAFRGGRAGKHVRRGAYRGARVPGDACRGAHVQGKTCSGERVFRGARAGEEACRGHACGGRRADRRACRDARVKCTCRPCQTSDHMITSFLITRL